MKMNRFRVNLHPAFFDEFLDRGYREGDKFNRGNYNPEDDTFDSGSLREVEITAKKLKVETVEKEKNQNALNDLRLDVQGNTEFSNVVEEIKNMPNVNKEHLTRLEDRCNAVDENSKNKEKYSAMWEKKINEGYGHLISALEENHYFDGKNKEEEMLKIKGMYLKEVKKQYKEKILDAKDSKFNEIKDTIFGRDSKDYPANKIYTKLTGAATILTVDRQYTEGYKADFLDGKPETTEKGDEDVETEIDKKNRKFLSNDLPEYLWNIRKTPGILNVMKWLPIFSVKVDRPSKVDREAISDFLKAANRIPTKDGKSPVMVLMESLHDNKLNTNSTIDTYVAVLESHGMDLDGFKKKGTNDVDYKQFRKCISKIMEVGNFYINTQNANNDVKDQHAIYLSVLGIIEDSKGAENAVNKFKDRVEKAKTDKKTEKKEGYATGEKLGETNPELYGIAKSLGITDFASATRLSELDDEYFKKTPVESILANLNNDKTIDAKDATVGGLKTGAQFLGIFKQVGDQIGKEKALSNLVEHAKLVNKTLGVGLPDALFNPKTIEADIKDGHTGIILLLQNVISNPGEDLYTLLSGHPENPFEGLDLQKENEAAQKYAEKMVKDMDMEGLRGIGLQTPEDIQTGLAGALFSEYKRGIGLGGQMSFDQWVKGLAMNTGFQVRDGGKVVVGIGLDYRRKINLGKGWSTTPDVSAGAFIPLGYGSPEGSGTVGLNEEVAKERITSKGVQNKLGMQAGATLLIPTVTPVISAGLTWERDKAAGIEYREQEMKGEMAKEIKTVLESINNRLGETPVKLDFNNAHTSSIIKEELESMAAKLGVKSEEVDSVVNATTRLLLNYNNANLSDENVRSIIAIRVADQYAMAWAEARKAHISKNTYLSGANLGAFRVVGSPLVGVYAGIKRTDHDLDGYGDRWGQEHTIDNSEMNSEMTEGRRTEKSLNALNTRLGLAEGQGLSFVDKSYPNSGIKIPNSLRNRVKVSKSMEGRLAKDESGNVLVSPWTIMSESVAAGAATQSKELLIGAGEKSDFVHLDTVGNNWFAKDIKEVNGIILEQSNAEFYTPDGIKKAINQLKQKTNNALLNQFNPSENEINSLIATLKELPEHNKKARIIIERQSDGNFIMRGERGVHEGKGLELEYKAKLEMFDTKAKELANKVYERAASLNDPTALNRVKHPIGQRHPEYEEFVSNLMGLNGKQKDINAAKTALDKIITRLNNSYKDKPLPIAETEWPTDKDALEQVLMSINNVFARSTKVKGAGSETADNVQYNKYEFTTNMGNIIKEREKQIGGTLQQKIKGENAEDVKNAYGRLMLATADYREKNKDKFNVTSAKSAHLNNAVGFNLGDQYNPENPLFDPEIYEQTIDLTDDVDSEYFTQADKDTLHRRAIENFITKPALFEPVKKVLGLPSSALVKIKDGAEIKNGVIELDIGGKIIKLSSDMKFGYFTQCVNHTIILDDVKLEDDKGNIVSFTSGSWANGRYVEGDKTSIVSTTTVGLSGSVIVHNGNNEPAKTDNTPVKTDDATQGGEQINTNPSGTDEVPVDPIIAGDGQETVSGDIR